ncbi:MAG: nucleoside-diphosphate kinase [Candidatus Auribacterota bacterium]|nr:nucleoside-diphosphate kinase [Candidatus Auribacterota bacterium]
MAVELGAVWINPYTIEKSRTGGVIARLLSLCPGELVAARMFTPSPELVEKYCRLIPLKGNDESRIVREQIHAYLRQNWLSTSGAKDRPRVMMLLFKGENIIRHIRSQVVGHIHKDSVSGETVRDTYGDYIKNERGEITYFEPAVFIIPIASAAEATLKLWARYSDKDGGVLFHYCQYPRGRQPERTLVMMKPENFKGQSSLAGNVIDIISRTGLKIIGAKIIHMSVEQAREFYGPVAFALPERMKSVLVKQLKSSLPGIFDFDIPDPIYDSLADQLKGLKGRQEFNGIIETMTGIDPEEVKGVKVLRAPGTEKCLALVYQGDRAISRIRSVLGATDPDKAEWATIRRIYAHSIGRNVAHASDSRQNVTREMEILKMEDNNLKRIINRFYRK